MSKESQSIKENANRHTGRILRLHKWPHSLLFTWYLHAFTHSFSDSLLQLHDLKVNSVLHGLLEDWKISSPSRRGQGNDVSGSHHARGREQIFFLGFNTVSSARRWGPGLKACQRPSDPESTDEVFLASGGGLQLILPCRKVQQLWCG